MKVYLAHNFLARDWLRETVKPFFEAAGHVVTSRWITDEHHLLVGYGPVPSASSAAAFAAAVNDLEDIESAGALVLFAEQYSDRPGRGKYVEFGYALRAGKTVVVVGSQNNPGCVFDHLPNIRHAKDYQQAVEFLPKGER
jgi:nucleoside 2-deoxyribosyltransferase